MPAIASIQSGTATSSPAELLCKGAVILCKGATPLQTPGPVSSGNPVMLAATA